MGWCVDRALQAIGSPRSTRIRVVRLLRLHVSTGPTRATPLLGAARLLHYNRGIADIGMDGYLATPIRPDELEQILYEVAQAAMPFHAK